MNLVEMLENTARKYRHRKCLIFGKERLTYGELNERVKRVANGLLKLGVRGGENVGILLGNCPEYVISYFGVLKAGATAVTLNNMLKTEELRFIVEDCKASAIITSSQFIDAARQLRLRVDSLKDIITVGGDWPDTLSFSRLLTEQPVRPADTTRAEPDQVASILYTSGTTGHPKGAMLTHNNLISNVVSAIGTINATHKDNFLCLLPMFHSFTLTVCVLIPIYVGARITIMESVRPFGRVIKSIIRHRATIFVGVPPIYNVLASAPVPRILVSRALKWVNPLRLCISGAAPLPVEVLKKFEKKFRIPLLEGYGLSETSPVVSINPLKGAHKPGSIGPPIPGVKVKVVDANDKEVPVGEVGELLVNGPNVMKGYLNLPEATKETIKDGWLYTGDMARIDEDGYIYIADRKKDMLIVRGLNVYPREVEEILYHHPSVAEAAVVGVPDESKGEVPKAYLALKEGARATEVEILHFLRERLANYKVPRHVEFRPSLPKTPTGKILKRGLRESPKSK